MGLETAGTVGEELGVTVSVGVKMTVGEWARVETGVEVAVKVGVWVQVEVEPWMGVDVAVGAKGAMGGEENLPLQLQPTRAKHTAMAIQVTKYGLK